MEKTFGVLIKNYAVAILLIFSHVSIASVYSSQEHHYKVDVVASSLKFPWGMDFLPDDKILVTEKSGALKIVNLVGSGISDVSGLPEVSECGQGGLMDVTLHPNFNENKRVYLSFSKKNDGICGTEAVSAVLSDNQLTEMKPIFSALPKSSDHRHFGSRFLFIDSKTLFISLGDRGHRPNGQDLLTHPGSLIRVSDLGIPPDDNPFMNNAGALPEIFSYGHRNIQGLAYDKLKNVIWAVEHGPKGGCELNRIEAGKNYGWADITYGKNYVSGTDIGEGTIRQDVEPPVYYWTPSNAPSGLAFYDSKLFPAWYGNLFVSSLTYEQLSRLVIKDGKVEREEALLKDQYGRLRHVAVGPNGSLFVLTDHEEDGKILRILPKD